METKKDNMEVGDIVNYKLGQKGFLLDGFEGSGQVLKIGKHHIIIADGKTTLCVEHSEIVENPKQ